MWLGMLLAASALLVGSDSGPLFPDDLPRGVGTWDPKILGNHRIVIEVPEPRTGSSLIAVRAHIPWRRRDKHPEQVAVLVTDPKGNLIRNVLRKEVNREFGDLAFEPAAGPGTYYAYHLPHKVEGSYYPKVTYTPPTTDADPMWAKSVSEMAWPDLPEAKAVRFESVSAFDAFTPMEVIATKAETDALLAKHPSSPYLVFPEDRHLNVRMWDDIPYRWAVRGANTRFQGTAKRGEYFTFQLGVWACRADLSDLKVRFSSLKLQGDRSPAPAISSKAVTCFNTSGIDYRGVPFTIDLSVPKGRVQPLWCGIDMPQDAKPGTYAGTAVVSAKGLKETRIPISLVIDKARVKNHGDDRPEDMTRLRWLGSRLAADDGIVQPFEPVHPAAVGKGAWVKILGREVGLDPDGFPTQISSQFAPRMDRLSKATNNLLADGFRFIAEASDGHRVPLMSQRWGFRSTGQTAVEWHLAPGPNNHSFFAPHFDVEITGRIEFDGTFSYEIALEANGILDDLVLNDIRLEIPLRKEVAKYFMGLGRDGGKAPESLDWKWDVKNAQEGAWVGSPNCGLMFALRDEQYVRPLNTNFYHEKPLVMPTSWSNGGKGGIRIRTEEDVYRITCYSGPRKMQKGETLHFNVHMLLTPFKPIDPKRHFSERYFHSFKPLDEIQAEGANVVNVHHATDINPWINYPFLGYSPPSSSAERLMREGQGEGDPGPTDKMRAYVSDAHTRGMKVKIYDTIRELTVRAPELFMLKSLGHEVFSSGKGGGGAWLREHLDEDYISAWHAVEVGDAAIVNSGMSRWHNYYIEGLDWLARNVGIDGLYLDDVAFDRTTMLRVRRVLERRVKQRSLTAYRKTSSANQSPSVPSSLRPSGNSSPSTRPSVHTSNLPSAPIIDLHSANQHNERDGWNNSALLYMDLMPFLDRLWFGEYFDYDKGPDFWLVELSGIPYGLMGEMLQNGGNPWRGMVFGMTARRPWSGDPRPLWKLWDEFGIADSEMIGWWADDCPVKTGRDDVLATVYKRKGECLIALASWADKEVEVSLNFNWKALGIEPAKAQIIARQIKDFQPKARWLPNEPIKLLPKKGWLLWIR